MFEGFQVLKSKDSQTPRREDPDGRSLKSVTLKTPLLLSRGSLRGSLKGSRRGLGCLGVLGFRVVGFRVQG